MIDLKKRSDESLEQYVWRVGLAKDNGQTDMTWPELARIMNPEIFDDELDYMDAGSFRKRYSTAKKFYDEVFSKENMDVTEERHAEMLSEIRRERQKLSDERTALKKTDRDQSRLEDILERLTEAVRSTQYSPLSVPRPYIASDEDLVIVLSDIHYGLTVENGFGSYNSDIARCRAQDYLKEILKIAETHRAKNAYVVLAGDLVSGRIHSTVQLENRENLVRQIQGVSELVSDFLYVLSQNFHMVYVNSVAGNHSRLDDKDKVLRDERADDLICWYAKAKLANIPNVDFVDDFNYDATIANVTVRSKKYYIVHGDMDAMTEASVSKLVMMTGEIPEAIIMGHRHKNAFETISNIKVIQSGCFGGSVDDYCVSKRMNGKPGQMVLVVSDRGVETLYPVSL